MTHQTNSHSPQTRTVDKTTVEELVFQGSLARMNNAIAYYVHHKYKALSSTTERVLRKDLANSKMGLDFYTAKNDRFVAIGQGKNFGTWAKGDTIEAIKQQLAEGGFTKGTKGFIIFGCETPTPIYCNDFGYPSFYDDTYDKPNHFFVVLDDRYESDKKRLPASEYFVNQKEQEDSGITVIFKPVEHTMDGVDCTIPSKTVTVGCKNLDDSDLLLDGAIYAEEYWDFDTWSHIVHEVDGIDCELVADGKTELQDYQEQH
jgi:hypothetical protein